VWAASEYDKLAQYDAPTAEQPIVPFACHATPKKLCHGWAVVHTNRGHEFDLLALRFGGYPAITAPAVPLFGSGTEAAEHGKRDIDNPSPDARRVMDRLQRKYPRLR
jgi:hypothetical protein